MAKQIHNTTTSKEKEPRLLPTLVGDVVGRGFFLLENKSVKNQNR